MAAGQPLGGVGDAADVDNDQQPVQEPRPE